MGHAKTDEGTLLALYMFILCYPLKESAQIFYEICYRRWNLHYVCRFLRREWKNSL